METITLARWYKGHRGQNEDAWELVTRRDGSRAVVHSWDYGIPGSSDARTGEDSWTVDDFLRTTDDRNREARNTLAKLLGSQVSKPVIPAPPR